MAVRSNWGDQNSWGEQNAWGGRIRPQSQCHSFSWWFRQNFDSKTRRFYGRDFWNLSREKLGQLDSENWTRQISCRIEQRWCTIYSLRLFRIKMQFILICSNSFIKALYCLRSSNCACQKSILSNMYKNGREK